MHRYISNVFSRLLFLIIALAASLVAKAQIYAPADAQVNPDSSSIDTTLTVSLLTAAPGSEIYQLEGHSGLRFQSASSDVVANWGLFDFNTPNFVYRFVKGETDYCVGLIPFIYFLLEYRHEGRRVTEQVLNLTHQQANELARLVTEAVRPENRTYRYNYVLDNCATRPISYIEQAVGDSIRFHTDSIAESATFRSEMKRFHKSYPWYQFGIDLALGSGIDQPISTRMACFAPVTLSAMASNATIGPSTPLVKQTRVLLDGLPQGTAEPPTPWYLTPLSICWLAAAITALILWRASRKHRIARGLTALWFSLLALAGCVVAFLVCISSHEATSPNWIILWINPICAIVPATIYISRARKILRVYMMANISAIILYLLVIAFGWQSCNSAFIPLIAADLLLSLSYIQRSKNA